MKTVLSSTKEKVCYSFGNMGGYVLWTFVATFITIYATDCLKLSASPLATLGTVILVCRFFDGISDIIMGIIIEKTHSRLGKARPWFGLSILPLCAVFALMFIASGFSDTQALIYVSVLYFLFAVVLYTMNNLGFNAMLPRISNDTLDQTKISTLNSVFTFVGGLVTAVAIPVLDALGGEEKQSSWTLFVLILAVFALATEALCFFKVKEKDEIAPTVKSKAEKTSVGKGLKALFTTKYFYIAAAMFLINYYLSLSVTASGKYYAQYVLGDVKIFSIFGALPGATMCVGLLLTPLLVKKIGKRKTMMAAVGAVALGNLIGAVLPYSFAAGLTGVMVKGLGSATVMCQLFTLAPDIVKLTEQKHGIRIEGLAASANSFGCKIGSGLGTAVVLWVLAFCGYNSSSAVQPASANTAFIALYSVVPQNRRRHRKNAAVVIRIFNFHREHPPPQQNPCRCSICLQAKEAQGSRPPAPTNNVVKFLRSTPCEKGCAYCRSVLNIHAKLKDFFGFDKFRTYNGEPLQENAAQAAVDGKSLLAVFPTGGGKSITFQLPALMAGESVHGLTVIISPLQSLMKDQVDNLNEKGLVDAVTVNGLLNPIERAEALERVSSGLATLLYISPEQLRSRTIERLLISRNVVRFVIDEAHCFSAWGQDFRVDYLYIGDFIRELQKKKQLKIPIPVSCFTATAKQKVISDICDYFQKKLDVNLELFTSSADRENLHYTVLYKETEEEKYNILRSLIEQKNCPTIVYVSRTRRTVQLAEKLTGDGFSARPFNGKMESNDKIANQEAFINNEVKVIVATSAFGMGVDKKDVKLVIHYDISDSLENYVQEAGRAGRDPSMQADCFVLFNDADLDKHFILLNQTKLSMSEIQQVWKAMKELTRDRPTVCCSPLEIARQAGWDDSVHEIETRVKTAISALESAGYLKRGRNVPHVYATSILAKNMEEASSKIENSPLFSESQRMDAKRIVKSLISSRSIAKDENDDAESRIDYLADILGIEKGAVVDSVNLMRQEGLLTDSMDMSAYILRSDTRNRSAQILDRFAKLEGFLLAHIDEEGFCNSLKEMNEVAINAGVAYSSVKNIRTLLYFLTIKGYITKPTKITDTEDKAYEIASNSMITPTMETSKLLDKYRRRIDMCRFIVEALFERAQTAEEIKEEIPVQFSLVGLFQEYQQIPKIELSTEKSTLTDMEDALLYLSKIGAMKLEGGFLVLYNGMEVKRLILNNRVQYKSDDYKTLSDYYRQKIQQIHIVGEYANLMVKDYDAAIQFVHDYFQIDFKSFIAKYFEGERAAQIERNITPEKYNQLFGELSDIQLQIINDADSRYIVVAAGPGSGKTRVLAHKLAALLLLEDVKHEQLLITPFRFFRYKL